VTRDLRAGIEIVSNTGETLYGFAASGSALVNLRRFLVEDGLGSGQVEHVPPDWTLPPLEPMRNDPPCEMVPPSPIFDGYGREWKGFDLHIKRKS